MSRWMLACSTGTSHHLMGRACEDVALCRSICTSNGEFFLAVSCDGCGSARWGGDGAKLAASETMTCLVHWLGGNCQVPSYHDLILFAIGHARQVLETEALQRGGTLSDLATTIIALISGSSGFAAAQVGDGVLVARVNGISGTVFWPREYGDEGTTVFLSSRKWRRELQSTGCAVAADGWFIASDGVQRISCDEVTRLPHPGFIDPLWAFLDQAPVAHGEQRHLSIKLLRFLDSERVNNETDDDKTIVAATR